MAALVSAFSLVVASVENSSASVPAPAAWPLVTLGLVVMLVQRVGSRRSRRGRVAPVDAR